MQWVASAFLPHHQRPSLPHIPALPLAKPRPACDNGATHHSAALAGRSFPAARLTKRSGQTLSGPACVWHNSMKWPPGGLSPYVAEASLCTLVMSHHRIKESGAARRGAITPNCLRRRSVKATFTTVQMKPWKNLSSSTKNRLLWQSRR